MNGYPYGKSEFPFRPSTLSNWRFSNAFCLVFFLVVVFCLKKCFVTSYNVHTSENCLELGVSGKKKFYFWEILCT